jgi:hypothetical protein
MNICENEWKYIFKSYNNSANVIFASRKAPVAGDETSTGLLHGMKNFQEPRFILFLKKEEA